MGDDDLVFSPARDKAAGAQTISVATSARPPRPRIGQIVADGLAWEALETLRALRRQPAQS